MLFAKPTQITQQEAYRKRVLQDLPKRGQANPAQSASKYPLNFYRPIPGQNLPKKARAEIRPERRQKSAQGERHANRPSIYAKKGAGKNPLNPQANIRSTSTDRFLAKIYQKRRGQKSAQSAGKNPPRAKGTQIRAQILRKKARAKIRPSRKQISA